MSKLGRLSLALGLLALAPRALAGDPSIAFEKYQLANGLTVILSPDHRLPQVAVDVWYHVGAANQAPRRSGFAHLFEHMMFSGSKHVQPSPLPILESIGGVPNGSTNFDRTNYFEVVPANELATALWIESDRLGFLLDTLDAKKLQVQRDVVSNERRQSYENRPYGLTFLRTCDLLYPSPHPYFQCVIGSIAEIQAASVDDVKGFFREFYGPQNASLALVGDFDPAQARVLIAQYFGAIPAGPAVKRPAVPQPKLAGVVKETLEDPVAEVPRFDLIWPGAVLFAADEPAGDVLAEVLAGSDASRLTRSMVHGSRVASSVSAGSQAFGLGGWFQLTAVANQGKAPAELLAPMQAAIDELKKSGPTIEELERAKRQFLAARVRGLERIYSRAELLNKYQTYLGDPGWLARDLARYRAVTPEEVRDFARRYLVDAARIELTTVPKAKVTK